MLSSESSASRVLNTPELIYLITQRWSCGDKTRLSQVSRQIFATLIPEIWQNVYGAENLIRLIPSASLQYELEESSAHLGEVTDYLRTTSNRHQPTGSLQNPMILKPSNKLRAITFNHTLDPNQLGHFDIYAPFVKRISIYRYLGLHSSGYFSLSGWPLLVSWANSRHQALLPNLESLSIATLDDHARTVDIPKWIKIFGSKNVTWVFIEIENFERLAGELATFQPELLLDTMGPLVKHCPNTQGLSIGPRVSPYRHYSATGSLPLASHQTHTHWYHYICGLPNLRYLTLSNGLVSSSSLIAVGQLKMLERLYLHVGGFEGLKQADDINSYITDTAFRALRWFALRDVSSRKVNDLLQIQSLLRSITELEVDYVLADSEGVDISDEIGDWLTQSLLPSITNAPHLEELRIYEHGGNEDEDDVYTLMTPQATGAIRAISQAPLKLVYLQAINLGDCRIGVDLGIMWSNVTELRLPSQSGSLEQLVFFAAIPRLELLLVKLSFCSAFTPADSPRYTAPLRVLESEKAPVVHFDFGTMRHNARMLLKLWPSLTHIKWDDYYISPEWSITEAKVFQAVLAICVKGKGEIEDNEFKSLLEPVLDDLLLQDELEILFC